MSRAPRGPARPWRGSARGAGLALGLWLAGSLVAAAECGGEPWRGAAMAGSVVAPDGELGPGPVAAWYEDPTTRYAHGVLGDTVEAGTLATLLATPSGCRVARVTLPQVEVFEDIAPRLADLDGDGQAEIIVVQSHARLGARLVIYGATATGAGLEIRAATPNIGRANRWLAPIGAADLTGDGQIEIAYIDRPHLARRLRVWTYEPGSRALREIATLDGLTTHRIGEPFISGGIRDCGTGPELVTADRDWRQVMVTRFAPDGGLRSEAIAPWSAERAEAVLACR